MYKNFRENGLVEIVCAHGVGHPSKLLTNPKYYYGVHGCDGCCDTEEFRRAELRFNRPPICSNPKPPG
jgi:hypothetical protein